MNTKTDAGRLDSDLSEGLGPLPPQRAGQASLMTITEQDVGRDIELGADEVGHWFSPAAVQERIDAAVAAERERWVTACCAAYADAMGRSGRERTAAADAVMAIRRACGA
jgi:hypothetical protein